MPHGFEFRLDVALTFHLAVNGSFKVTYIIHSFLVQPICLNHVVFRVRFDDTQIAHDLPTRVTEETPFLFLVNLIFNSRNVC